VSEPVDATPAAETPSVSAVSALWKVLFEPKATFEGLREKSPWALPFFLGVILIMAFTWFTWPYIIDQRAEVFRMNENLPAEAKARIMDQLAEVRNEPSPVQTGISSIVVAIATLIGAGIWLMVGNVVLGGNATFKQIWSMFNYAGMVSLVGVVVKWLMVSMKGSMNVYTSLALFAPDLPQTSYTFLALNGVDIFSIWLFAVIGIGLAAVCKVATQKAMVASFVVWAIWVFGIQSGLGSMAGGLMGM